MIFLSRGYVRKICNHYSVKRFPGPVPPTLSSGWPLCEHLGPGDLWHCAMNIIGISSPMDWLKGKSWKIYRKPTIFPWNMGVSCNFSLKPIDISFRATLIFFLPLCQLHFRSPQSTRCGCRVVPRLGSGFTAHGLQNSFFREQTWELWLAGTSWDWECDDVGNANWRERERENKKNIYTHTHNYYTYTYTYTHTHTRYITLHYNTLD